MGAGACRHPSWLLLGLAACAVWCCAVCAACLHHLAVVARQRPAAAPCQRGGRTLPPPARILAGWPATTFQTARYPRTSEAYKTSAPSGPAPHSQEPATSNKTKLQWNIEPTSGTTQLVSLFDSVSRWVLMWKKEGVFVFMLHSFKDCPIAFFSANKIADAVVLSFAIGQVVMRRGVVSRCGCSA